MKALYFDCISGASGDMVLGALIDAGADVNKIRDELSSLSMNGWDLEVREVTRGSIRATRCEVVVAAGTSDLPVADEAAGTADAVGAARAAPSGR